MGRWVTGGESPTPAVPLGKQPLGSAPSRGSFSTPCYIPKHVPSLGAVGDACAESPRWSPGTPNSPLWTLPLWWTLRTWLLLSGALERFPACPTLS